MTFDGINYRLTRHGRRRFRERTGLQIDDREILRRCVGDPRAIWKPDRVNGFRLVTYLATEPKP